MAMYVFFREGMFYPIELRDDNDVQPNVRSNPGTIRVETWDGRVVWEESQPKTETP